MELPVAPASYRISRRHTAPGEGQRREERRNTSAATWLYAGLWPRTTEPGQAAWHGVIYTTTYALPQPDFSSIALAIKNANPDAVLLCSYYPDAVGIAQALHRIGYTPKYLAETIGPAEAEFIKRLGRSPTGSFQIRVGGRA